MLGLAVAHCWPQETFLVRWKCSGTFDGVVVTLGYAFAKTQCTGQQRAAYFTVYKFWLSEKDWKEYPRTKAFKRLEHPQTNGISFSVKWQAKERWPGEVLTLEWVGCVGSASADEAPSTSCCCSSSSCHEYILGLKVKYVPTPMLDRQTK